jgi:hypothetical protein
MARSWNQSRGQRSATHGSTCLPSFWPQPGAAFRREAIFVSASLVVDIFTMKQIVHGSIPLRFFRRHFHAHESCSTEAKQCEESGVKLRHRKIAPSLPEKYEA